MEDGATPRVVTPVMQALSLHREAIIARYGQRWDDIRGASAEDAEEGGDMPDLASAPDDDMPDLESVPESTPSSDDAGVPAMAGCGHCPCCKYLARCRLRGINDVAGVRIFEAYARASSASAPSPPANGAGSSATATSHEPPPSAASLPLWLLR